MAETFGKPIYFVKEASGRYSPIPEDDVNRVKLKQFVHSACFFAFANKHSIRISQLHRNPHKVLK